MLSIKKRYVLTKFIIKYNYLYKYFLYIIIIHINYKPLIYFLKLNIYKNIYKYWANHLKRLNIVIKYIFGQRNKVVNNLLWTLFYNEDYDIKKAIKILKCKEI